MIPNYEIMAAIPPPTLANFTPENPLLLLDHATVAQGVQGTQCNDTASRPLREVCALNSIKCFFLGRHLTMSTHDDEQVKVELARAQCNPAMNTYINIYIDMACLPCCSDCMRK